MIWGPGRELKIAIYSWSRQPTAGASSPVGASGDSPAPGPAQPRVLHPNGSYELAAVKPLADHAVDTWSSPTSGKAYPTRRRLEIPSLKTDLTMRVTGKNYVEMVGDWSG
ncbi:hypothetical protein ABZ619_10235 [Streptomyces sp. NPDC007851]|uniref:hypothetical protein n=1 Tax=Streptomyces sp. NPDC007851 TaxID=3155008 RepID=UPI0033FF49AD